jgi:hypothetical protein
MTPKIEGTGKKKKDKLNIIKTKTFCVPRDTTKRVKRTAKGCRKMLANQLPDMRYIFNTHTVFYRPEIK